MAENVTASISLTKWDLISSAAMAACLDDLVRMGHHGQVRGYRDEFGATVWDMEAHSEDNTNSVVTQMGNVVVMLSGHLSAMTTEQYQERYGS